VSNPNAIVLEEIVEEESFENFDKEGDITHNEVLELVQMDEGTSYFYIFDEKEDPYYSQDNVVYTRAQVNKLKTKEAPEKEKVKINNEEPVKQQTTAEQKQTLLQMNYLEKGRKRKIHW